MCNEKISNIGNIGNYYGNLQVKETGGKYYWGITNYDGVDWEEISKFTYTVLLRQHRRILQRESKE